MMSFAVLFIVFVCSIFVFVSVKGSNLEEITHKVFFDISINGEPAGRITFGLCKCYISFIVVYLILF